MTKATPFSKKAKAFLEKWTFRRNRKWKYLLKRALLWGLLMGIPTHLLSVGFDFSAMGLVDMLVRTIIFGFTGLIYSNYQFKAQDKRWRAYQTQRESNSSSQM